MLGSDGDKVIVCDRENSRVQVFDFDGNFVSESSHHRAVSCAKVRTHTPPPTCLIPLVERICRRREAFKPTLQALKSSFPIYSSLSSGFFFGWKEG
eukprot:COSAG04_NODE_1317_length_7248_cov_10.699119_6_plen_96_part_00